MQKYALYIAWLLCLIATLSSLFLSEILDWPICSLCWYQRICLYPLSILLGMACFRDDQDMALYALPLSLLGAMFAIYQYLEQMIPGFAPLALCGNKGPSCDHIDWILGGFITLPLLSFLNFIALSGLFLLVLRHKKRKTLRS